MYTIRTTTIQRIVSCLFIHDESFIIIVPVVLIIPLYLGLPYRLLSSHLQTKLLYAFHVCTNHMIFIQCKPHSYVTVILPASHPSYFSKERHFGIPRFFQLLSSFFPSSTSIHSITFQRHFFLSVSVASMNIKNQFKMIPGVYSPQ
jgi:hypothetical protein